MRKPWLLSVMFVTLSLATFPSAVQAAGGGPDLGAVYRAWVGELRLEPLQVPQLPDPEALKVPPLRLSEVPRIPDLPKGGLPKPQLPGQSPQMPELKAPDLPVLPDHQILEKFGGSWSNVAGGLQRELPPLPPLTGDFLNPEEKASYLEGAPRPQADRPGPLPIPKLPDLQPLPNLSSERSAPLSASLDALAREMGLPLAKAGVDPLSQEWEAAYGRKVESLRSTLKTFHPPFETMPRLPALPGLSTAGGTLGKLKDALRSFLPFGTLKEESPGESSGGLERWFSEPFSKHLGEFSVLGRAALFKSQKPS